MSLGKCCLQVPDQVGGLAMRIWLPALNEAGLLIKEGVPIDRIDQAMRRFGMTYGPCEWMDRLGIDRIADLANALQPAFAGRIQFESGFAAMTQQQLLGNKSGRGFYRRAFPQTQAECRGGGDLAHGEPGGSDPAGAFALRGGQPCMDSTPVGDADDP